MTDETAIPEATPEDDEPLPLTDEDPSDEDEGDESGEDVKADGVPLDDAPTTPEEPEEDPEPAG